jgi:hypothetical protein
LEFLRWKLLELLRQEQQAQEQQAQEQQAPPVRGLLARRLPVELLLELLERLERLERPMQWLPVQGEKQELRLLVE